MQLFKTSCLAGLFLLISSTVIAQDNEGSEKQEYLREVMICDTTADLQIDNVRLADVTCFSGEREYLYNNIQSAMKDGWQPFSISTGNAATSSYQTGLYDKEWTRNIYSKVIFLMEKWFLSTEPEAILPSSDISQ